MDIRQLKYLATIAELGSFSRAAGVLHITQPSLSKQIRNLEDSLGRPLLVRNGRGVVPTEAGERLIRHALRILEQVAQAESDVKATGAGRFAIGLPFTIAATIASDLIARLRAAEPSANLAIVQGRSAFLLESLWAAAIDVAIMFTPSNSPLIEATPLVSEDLFFMVPARTARSFAKKTPITLESISEYPLIVPGRLNAIRSIVEHAFKRMKKTPVFAMEIDNVATIFDLVAKGQGYAVLSNLSRNLSTHANEVIPIPLAKPGLQSEICLAVSTRGSLTHTKRKLVKLAGDIGRDLLKDAAKRRPDAKT